MLSGKFSFKTYSFEIFGWFIKKHFFRSLKYSKNDLDSSFLLIWFRTHPKICTFCHNCLVLVFQFFVGKGVRLTYKRERSRSPAWLPSRVSVSHFHLAAGPLNQAALYYPGAQLTQGSNLTLCSQTTPPPIPLTGSGAGAQCHLPFLCPEFLWVSKACWAFPCTISHTPPLLSIPIAPIPLPLQAWMIIIAS